MAERIIESVGSSGANSWLNSPGYDRFTSAEIDTRIIEEKLRKTDLANKDLMYAAQNVPQDIPNSEHLITSASNATSSVMQQISGSLLSNPVNTTNSASTVEETHRQSRAAKRREKRATQRKAQEEALSNSSVSACNSARSKELLKIEAELDRRNLRPYEVPSDGDCLYMSIGHQLSLRKISFHDLQLLTGLDPPVQEWAIIDLNNPKSVARFLRLITSRYLAENMNEFLPFMFNPETGEPMTNDEFIAYCDSVQQPSTWGGQVELRALANALRIPIEVIQADAPPILIGEEFNGPPITILFHRHAFALGEHYNSCVSVDSDS